MRELDERASISQNPYAYLFCILVYTHCMRNVFEDHRLFENRFFVLKDGRKLCYCEYGDPKGFPIISCHGGMVCRLDIEHAANAAQKTGTRIISIDRPGVGYSDYQTNRTQLDWSQDVKELCDHLHLPYFSVLGWSLGGQYALTCGSQLKERVKKVGVIAGAIPMDFPNAFNELNDMDRFFITICTKYPKIAKYIFKTGYVLAKYSSKFLLYILRHRFSHSLPSEHYVTMFAQGIRHSPGIIQEFVIFGKPWGFLPHEITVPIIWWQGGQDALVSPKWLNVVQKIFPNVKIIVYPHEGHFLASQHYEEILAALKF